MSWINLVMPRAIISRRRFVASALIYGLSLTVRTTSATGDDMEAAPQLARANLTSAITTDDSAAVFRRSFPRPAQPFAFHFGWPAGPGGCRAMCESAAPALNCGAP